MYTLLVQIGAVTHVREILHEASPELQIYLQNERGVLTINGIHTLHRFWKIARLLLPTETLRIESVSLEKGAFPGAVGEDRATGVLRLAGSTFQFDVAYVNGPNCANGWPIEYVTEIKGTHGSIRVTGWERCDSSIGGRWENAYAHPDGPLHGTSQYPRIRLGVIEQVRDFFRFFREGGHLHHTLKEALHAQLLLEKCYAAARVT